MKDPDVNDPTVAVKIRTHAGLTQEQENKVQELAGEIIKILAPEKAAICLAAFAGVKGIFYSPKLDIEIPEAVFLGVTPDSKYFHHPKL